GSGFNFTEEELSFVLYGAIASPEHPTDLQHAISGILVPTESSGSNHLHKTLDKDSLQLPEGLCLMQTSFGDVPHFGVFCSDFIAKGVRFGPFRGRVVNASEVKAHRDNSRMWEIFEDGHLSHFIDGKGSGNWMSYVNCARFPKEQNLLAVQHQGQIFYESCRDIQRNQELLVWYGNGYEKFLGVPMNLRVTEGSSGSSGSLPATCGARQLSKLKRFLTTLQQFGNDISPEIGEKVRTLVLALVNSTVTIEEFHCKLQEATNFPLRPFVIPFLKANLPLLQRELLHCARAAKQTPSQYLAQHEKLLLNTS
uniref:PR domain zinc finger protein 14,Protein CBFA2T2 n=1 Tax=Mus musculus TaxID=10090 RepID=UPI000719A09D|nr:Chain A, PR domain zinc finger protein 14,Protein CBFA2T2 [Mus musculus]5ECJ_B Chain B, PR domain zinc finger protein 14,Protein CBFA2T2 [Mus musculus]